MVAGSGIAAPASHAGVLTWDQANEFGPVLIAKFGPFFRADQGEVSRLTVAFGPASVSFRDTASPLEYQGRARGCRAGRLPRQLVCPAPGTARVAQIELSSGADTALVAGSGTFSVSGHGGNDTLRTLSPRINYLGGGDGSDRLIGGPGRDYLQGDKPESIGANTVGFFSDVLQGGPGADLADYSDHLRGVVVDLRRPTPQGATGERDVFSSIESVRGSGFVDVLTGTNGPNRIIDIGGNGDRISALGGNDLIQAVDDGRDTINCGLGRDRVVANRDDLLVGCEVVRREEPPPE